MLCPSLNLRFRSGFIPPATVVLFSLLLLAAPVAQAQVADLLILSTTVTNPGDSVEEQEAAALGLSVNVVTPEQWAALTTDDFAQYRAVKEAAQRDARQRQLAAARERHEQALAARRARAEEIRAERARADAEQQRLDRYADAGFADLGLDVFGGRMSFSYALRNQSSAWVDYDPIVGLYYRPGGPSTLPEAGSDRLPQRRGGCLRETGPAAPARPRRTVWGPAGRDFAKRPSRS